MSYSSGLLRTMKAGRFTGPRKVEIIDVPIPEIEVNQVQIKLEVACLCGSDSPMFNTDYEALKAQGIQANSWCVDYDRDEIYPLSTGLSLHECIGTVSESRSERFKVGDFVLGIPIAQHGFFEYLTLSEERVYAMPNEVVSKPEILMSQPLGTVLFGMRKLPDVSGKSVAIVGMGPIGLLWSAYLDYLGASSIFAIDKLGYRVEVSKEMGSTAQIDSSNEDPVEAVKTLTDGKMAEIVIEAAGHCEMAIDLATELIAMDGDLLQFGVTDVDRFDNYPAGILYGKNVSVHNTVGAIRPKEFLEAADLIAAGKINVKPLLTHTFKFDDAQTAFEHYVDRLDGALKVLLEFP